MHTAQRGSRRRSSTHSERFRPTTRNASPSHWYQSGTTIGQPSDLRWASLSSHVLSAPARKSWTCSTGIPPAPESSS